MDTYVNLTGKKIKIGEASLIGIESEVYREIIKAIDTGVGGASVSFKKLTDEDFARLTASISSPAPFGKESYIVEISESIAVYYTAEITKIYALYAIKRHYDKDGIKQGIIYNTPRLEFRCFRSYLPPKDGIESFKRFIDMLLAFGHNTLMLEIGGALEYKRHPEINDGWVEYCKIFEEFNGKTEWVQRMAWYPKNAIHCDNGGGNFLTHNEAREIVEYCRERHMEIIPEVPSLCHVDYLLYNHPELSEIPGDILPNNACPENEDYYKLIFDVLDEVCEVFRPARVNICHDEAYVFGQCPKCKDKDAAEQFARHMTRLHDHLAGMGVRTMIWGDGILPQWHGGNSAFHRRFPWDGERIVNVHGKNYEVHNFKCLNMEEWEEAKAEDPNLEGLYVPPKKNSINLIPRDIDVMNWSWSIFEEGEKILSDYGFYHVYGNFNALSMPDFSERIKNGVRGISFSNWGCTNFEAMQRNNSLFGLACNCLAAWSVDFDGKKKTENTFKAASAVYEYLNYETLRGKHLEIVHTSDNTIDHNFFHDGFVIVKEDYRLGSYDIKYTDGTHDEYKIYWGHNIGQRRVCWDKNDELSMSVEDGGQTKYIYEPIGESMPIADGKETFYKTVIPVEKDVESVTLKTENGYSIEFKGFSVKY